MLAKKLPLCYNTSELPLWWNWQTHGTQNPAVAIPCRFDPDQRHQCIPAPLIRCGFRLSELRPLLPISKKELRMKSPTTKTGIVLAISAAAPARSRAYRRILCRGAFHRRSALRVDIKRNSSLYVLYRARHNGCGFLYGGVRQTFATPENRRFSQRT